MPTARPEPLTWRELVQELCRDDESAAAAHLAAGRPIYYRERDTPNGLVVRESADGRRDLIRVDAGGAERIVCSLPRPTREAP